MVYRSTFTTATPPEVTLRRRRRRFPIKIRAAGIDKSRYLIWIDDRSIDVMLEVDFMFINEWRIIYDARSGNGRHSAL